MRTVIHWEAVGIWAVGLLIVGVVANEVIPNAHAVLSFAVGVVYTQIFIFLGPRMWHFE